ncbi:HSPB1-associated protein 1 homolog [Danio rerio]|uniref:HSPB1-associated protein 1 homolog n=1 Tax=Danio rerio TaxID=7955 RepID=UPI000040281D|nr:HSPB1-associated protein 1 homolog [Danio rerio]AAH79489.1 Hspb associated protein 1 [Danio rerio]|eukprot:NP_001003777.1 HSPB1-associated protein 1 homolog [Danio rerio]
MSSKPFTPEEARRIVQVLQKPAVFLNMTTDWPALHWTVEHLSACLTERIRFRVGKRSEDMAPLFETECSYVEATIKEFLSWTANDGEPLVGAFSDYHCKEFWAYADYKYIAQLFQDKPAMFQDVVWSDFGFPGRDGRDSTLWIGTQCANTPCHLDSYGCNLVFQIQGRKRWHLFPPDDTACLYPTRVPYEESSVFSHVNVIRPDLKKFPAYGRARLYTVTLQPGQVLFVPRHWWHYVESVDPVTVSVNSWIEMDMDDEARVAEALTKTIVCAVKSSPSLDNSDQWLNPTEDGVSSHDENMQYLNLAVKACMNKKRDDIEDQPKAQAVKRDFSGVLKSPASPPSLVSFGPHLIPVHLTEKPQCSSTKDSCCFSCTDSPQCQITTKDQDKLRSDNKLGQRSGQSVLQDTGSPGGSGEMHISTNDVLECLVHPDVIALVTRLIMCRQRELHS